MSYQRLKEISDDLMLQVKTLPFVREQLFAALEPPKQNVVILKGARGIGKSTLLLQFLLKQQQAQQNVLYVSADSTLLETSLAELAYEYHKRGGRYLAIDEIHKYNHWQAEIKTILDAFTDLKILVSGSSSIHLDYAAADLSRRHIMLNAQGLSLREYLVKHWQLSLKSYSLNEILNNAADLAASIIRATRSQGLDLLTIFKDYLKSGYFLSRDNYTHINLYYASLLNTISSTIDADLPYVFQDIDNISKQKIRALLKHIATKCPFTPNIAELSRNLSIASDNTLKKYLYYLHEGEVLTNLYAANKSHKDFQKPQKIFLNNTNFFYAYNDLPNLGMIRETFVANCLIKQGELTAPTNGDFCLNGECFFEVGGRSKNKRQLKSLPNAFVFADDIVSVDNGNLPLWLLGFLW